MPSIMPSSIGGNGPFLAGFVGYPPDFNPRSLRNFHAQAHGAEILRLACCLGVEAGIEICAPVHDAVLICSPSERLVHDVERMRAFMAEASRIVLEDSYFGPETRTRSTTRTTTAIHAVSGCGRRYPPFYGQAVGRSF